jgi:hypothetical protein
MEIFGKTLLGTATLYVLVHYTMPLWNEAKSFTVFGVFAGVIERMAMSIAAGLHI